MLITEVYPAYSRKLESGLWTRDYIYTDLQGVIINWSLCE